MSVGMWGRVRLLVKFETSRRLPSGIFFWGLFFLFFLLKGKTKSTPGPKAKAWTLDWSLTKKKQAGTNSKLEELYEVEKIYWVKKILDKYFLGSKFLSLNNYWTDWGTVTVLLI